MEKETEFDTFIEKINNNITIGNYQRALELITFLKPNIHINKGQHYTLLRKELEVLYELGWIHIFRERALEFFKVVENSAKLPQPEIFIYYYYIDVLIQTGKISEALLTIKKWNSESKYVAFLQNPEFKVLYYLSLATIYTYIALDEAEEYIYNSLKLSEKFNDKTLYALSCYRLGRIFAHKGEINEAMKNLKKSLDYGELLDNKILVANSLISIGEIYRLKGDFAKALEYYNNALIIYKIQNNKAGISNAYNNIGIVYYSINDFDSATAYFSKSIGYAKEVGFQYIIAESAYYLIRISLFSKNITRAKDYLEMLQKPELLNNPFVKFYVLLSEAVILRENNRFSSFTQAQEKLRTLINNNKLYHEINIHAMLNLIDLLLYELRLTNNNQILVELEELIDQLLALSKSTLSRSLLAETYWLKGKLALLERDMNKSLEFLSIAEKIANQQQLQNLAERIKNDRQALENELSKWQQLLQEDSTLSERISQTAVDELVISMIKRVTYELEETQVDDPILLLIVSDTGIPVYSYSFKDANSVEKNILLSGFLSAMNNLLGEFFQTRGTIKKIEHQEYLMLFQSVSSVGVCYVYTGGTFSAKKKLKELIKAIESDFLKDFEYAIETSSALNKEKIEKIEEIVKRIFCN